jgi:TM2 domain-containing membrane protein YozV
MPIRHKNKTLAALLASLLGGAGIHRFYLGSLKDRWGWLHGAALAVTALGLLLGPNGDPVYSMLVSAPLIISILAGALQALLIGLTPDEKWDARYNPGSSKQTSSTWQLALILVLTLAVGMGGLIFAITRSIDLFVTGGSYG